MINKYLQSTEANQIADYAHSEAGMNRNARSLQGMANNYYSWNLNVFSIKPHKRILDLGCGPGLYFEAVMSYQPDLYMAMDLNANYLKQAEALARGRHNCQVGQIDLLSDKVPDCLAEQIFDYAFCFDVLEHIQDDGKALRNIRSIMVRTGTPLLFLRVPAVQFIYGKNDEAIGHFRRYSSNGLAGILRSSLFRVIKMRYQNIFGILPWYFVGKVLNRSLAVSKNEASIFNMIAPALSFLEGVIPPPIGLSLYCICSPEERP